MIIILALSSLVDQSTIIPDVDKLPPGLNFLSNQVTLTLHYIIISPQERYSPREACLTVTVPRGVRLCLYDIPPSFTHRPRPPFRTCAHRYTACMPGQRPASFDPYESARDGPVQQPERHHDGPREVHRQGVQLGHGFAGRSHRSRFRDRRCGKHGVPKILRLLVHLLELWLRPRAARCFEGGKLGRA